MSRLPARGTPLWLAVLWLWPLLVRGRVTRLTGALVAAGALGFFRDPERTPAGPGALAAADGRIIAVDRQPDGRWLVATYLNLLDVHVTRAPLDATVTGLQHTDGTHHRAATGTASSNERLDWWLVGDDGPLCLTQFSGAVARRIVPYLHGGERLTRGQRVGLIRFGSRVDVLLPPGWAPIIAVGDRVKAGTTVIARFDDREQR